MASNLYYNKGVKPKSLTDEKLASLVRERNQEYYREIVIRYQVKLKRYANYILKNKEDAEDVVQEAFIKAFKNLNSFDTKKKFSSWIYRIVHNEAMNWIAKRKKIISLDENEDWVENISDESEPLEDVFDKKQIAKKIRTCINDMPIAYRTCMAFFYIEERSYEEISDILMIPTGTVGTKISRGKTIFRQIYEKKKGEKQW